jgi:hypothetical protein
MLNLPEPIAQACRPLFEALPLEQAMPHLTGSHPKYTALVQEILQDPVLASRPELAAGLWLYVDDLERSHAVCQEIETPTGSYWHGIMHRREGDYSNSRYWHRRAASHPLLQNAPEGLIAEVEKVQGKDDPAVVARQRQEWAALFEWCAANG